MKKIWVTGASGLVGGAIVRHLSRKQGILVKGTSSGELNLLELDSIREFLYAERPDSAILAGARVGGVGANVMQPADFVADNLMMQTNVLQAAHEFKIPRLVFLSSSCIYSTKLEMPLKENVRFGADLDESVRPYAIAKIAGMEIVRSMRKQHGHDWVSVIPSNIYGPGDNFSLSGGHVVASLIRKFAEAVAAQKDQVEIWGSGAALREFTHIDDMASAIATVEENFSSEDAINVSSGEEISIRDLASQLQKVSGFRGEVVFDRDKPEGALRKLQDNSKLLELGWKPQIPLSQGLPQTYQWFKNQMKLRGNTLRL